MSRALSPVLLAISLALAGTAGAQQADSFPHAKHAALFPSCLGCHTGVAMKDSAVYPPANSCSGCHDGTQKTSDGRVIRKVNWQPRATYAATNLIFSHLTHAQKTHTERDTKACVSCHQQAGTTQWMSVVAARPETCITCHEHAAPSHLAAGASCSTCHVPLAQATHLTSQQISGFPTPDSHNAPDYLSKHAPADQQAASQCAICHTQQSCARCHMNASTTPSIVALGSNAAVAQAVASKPAQYPLPSSHTVPGFAESHAGAATASYASCGNCHARQSCQTCHLQVGAHDAIAKLPTPAPGGAQGVQLRRANPTDLLREVTFRTAAVVPPNVKVVHVHPADWIENHRTAAASGAANCASCHLKRYCADCHDGVGRIKYHPQNFVQGHAAQAYGREQDCASCHNNEAFCVSCHKSTGIAATGNRNGATHNQSPNWLIDHAQAARLELANCTTCHKQADCMQCHSTTTWGVNPHGPDFNAKLMAAKNSQICYYCHLTNPVKE